MEKQFKVTVLTLILMALASTIYAQKVSEKDIKTNVVNITNALEKVKQLEPVTYEYNTHKYKLLQLQEGKTYGFIADQFQNVFPEMVYDKHVSDLNSKQVHRDLIIKKMDIESLIPVLVASIKELEAEVEKLKAELNTAKKYN